MSISDFPDLSESLKNLTMKDSILLLYSSVAIEEFALAHLINAEAEKLDTILCQHKKDLTCSSLIRINDELQSSLSDIVNKEMLLLNKLENITKLHHGKIRLRPRRRKTSGPAPNG